MAIHNAEPAGQAPLDEEARTFLRLLDEVSQIQRLLLEEGEVLRARVRELETGQRAGSGGSAATDQEGRLP